MSRQYIVISLSVILLAAHAFFPAYAIISTINISGITNNQIFTSTFSSFSGTYSSPDPPFKLYSTKAGTFAHISIVLDNRSYGTPTLTGSTWSISGKPISDGWHTVTIYLDDENGEVKIAKQFYVLTKHVTPLKYTNFIAVEYSNTCLTMIKNHINGSCPQVSELAKWDTSDQGISGHFVLQKDGTLTRDNPQIKNHYTFYSAGVVCVLCTGEFASQSTTQVIFIEPDHFSYASTDPNNSNIITQNSNVNSTIEINDPGGKTLSIYHDVSYQGCNSANIFYSVSLMNETLNNLKSGCTLSLSNHTTTQKVNNTPIDYSKAPQYIYNKYVASGLKASVGNCITKVCSTPANPQHNSGFGWK